MKKNSKSVLLKSEALLNMLEDLEEAKKKAEESEKKYKLLAENSTDVIYTTDINQRFTYVSPSVKKLAGYSPEELISKEVKEILTPESFKKQLKDMKKSIKKGELLKPKKLELEGLCKDGSKIWIEIHARFLLNKERKPVGILGIAHDVTERKKAEEELRFHSEIIKNMAEGVYLIRVNDGVIVYTNPKFEKMFGYSSGEMVGKHVSIVNAPIEKSSKKTAKEIMAVLKGDGVWKGEVYNIKKDGTPFWCYATTSTFNHPVHGKVWVSVHTDITKQKEMQENLKKSEEKFKDFIENANDLIQSVDINGKFTYVNKKWRNILGYTDKEVKKLHFTDILRKDQIPHCVGVFNKLRKGHTLNNVETVFTSKKGKEIFVSGNINAQFKDNKFIATRGIFRDITEQKKAEEKLLKQKEKCEKEIKELKKRLKKKK